MAGPSVMVRILGEVSGLAKSFTDAGTAGEGAASKLHSAFSGALNALNQTGVLGPFGEALGGVNEALGQVAEHGKEIAPAMMGVGTAMAGIGVGLTALASKNQAAQQQLSAAIQATGGSYDDYRSKVADAVKEEEKHGETANETENALTALTEATHNPTEALNLLSTAANVAAAKHESLTQAATDVGKVYNGNTKLLKEFGVVLPPTTKGVTDHSAALADLAKVTAGQADAQTNTFMGHLDAMKAKLEDSAATLGAKYGPAITAAGSVMAGLGATMQVVTVIQTALTAVTWASLAPYLLIAVAVAGLIAVGVLLYKNWDTIWNGIKAIVMDVWNWIQQYWPYILGFLLGPIALAAAAIYKNFDTIKGWANDLVNFFEGIGRSLGGIFTHMWDGMVNAFRAVLNAIIDLWNQLHFTLPKVDVLGVHIGGETIGVPNIPHLAQGGLITRDGLVYAHAGEAITPAPGGATGPLVQINGATFNSATDVDMIAAKLEFATQAGLRLT